LRAATIRNQQQKVKRSPVYAAAEKITALPQKVIAVFAGVGCRRRSFSLRLTIPSAPENQ
jgi:hypothetical protein